MMKTPTRLNLAVLESMTQFTSASQQDQAAPKVLLNSHGEVSTHVEPSRRALISQPFDQRLHHQQVLLLHQRHHQPIAQLATQLHRQQTHQHRSQRSTQRQADQHSDQPRAQPPDQPLHQLLIQLSHQLVLKVCSPSRAASLHASPLREPPHSTLNEANTSQSLAFQTMQRSLRLNCKRRKATATYKSTGPMTI